MVKATAHATERPTSLRLTDQRLAAMGSGFPLPERSAASISAPRPRSPGPGMSICFITGSARSGTTSLLRALGLSSRADVALEPFPTLNRESRDLYDGRLADPYAVVARDVAPRVARALDRGKIYIEKHVSLVPFIPHLAELFPCRF